MFRMASGTLKRGALRHIPLVAADFTTLAGGREIVSLPGIT